MTRVEARKAIESLRKGIPPDGQVGYFTVGRGSEIRVLAERIRDRSSGALLLCANYGSGKTHLLRLTRELALQDNYLVSTVSLDARSAVRFNRLDQILGSVGRAFEVHACQQRGLACLLDRVARRVREEHQRNWPTPFWRELSNSGRWDCSEILKSSALYVALRAWLTGDSEAQQLVEDWLLQPWVYQGQRKALYHGLVEALRSHFRDPRREWQFYADDVFVFNSQDYHQSWAALQDIQSLAQESGLNGLVLLFDEVEDILHNLNNVAHQEKALDNLFRFFGGQRFRGMSYYGVTPDFREKCKKRLLEKGRWDYDYSRFDALPEFEMSPLDVAELHKLSLRIMKTHGVAYSWEPDLEVRASELRRLVEQAAQIAVQDRVRQTVTQIVTLLDSRLEGTA